MIKKNKIKITNLNVKPSIKSRYLTLKSLKHILSLLIFWKTLSSKTHIN